MPLQPFLVGTKNKSFIDGYTDDARNASANQLCPPSINMNITKTGECVTRLGYISSGINLSEANKAAEPFYVEQFDITFFALGTKVKYYEWANDAVYDTGITLTDGEISRFEEYNGVVYVTNPTDGCYGFLVTRLNGAVAGGAATIVTDVAGAAVASAFDTQLSPGTKNLRIEGTNEQYASITVNTGTFTLSGTSSQAYNDNDIAIVVYDLTSVIPKGSKIVAWKESLNLIGVSVDDTTGAGDRRETTMYFSQFATAATSEASVTWSGGTAGSELVGKAGFIRNLLATRDYLYIFKEGETYFISIADVNASTGARPPQLLSSNYGCINEDCAVDLGNGLVAFLTNNNRIIGIRIATDSGAAVVFPDESFDAPIRSILDDMDDVQSNPQMFYSKIERRMFVEIDVDGVRTTLKYNNEIGRWEPPDTGKAFRGYFERKGDLYATDSGDDTIYEMGTGFQDNGNDIDFVSATPIIEFEDGRTTLNLADHKKDEEGGIELSGSISENTTVTVENIVNNGTPQKKTFDSTGISFALARSLGSVTLGDTTIGSSDGDIQFGDWDKKFGIYPVYGSNYQCVLSSIQPYTWKSYRLKASALTSPVLTLS